MISSEFSTVPLRTIGPTWAIGLFFPKLFHPERASFFDMSLRAILWAFDQDVFPPSRKLTLLALSNFSSDTGKSYPSVSTMCRLTGQKDDTVRTCLASLVEDGIIADTGQKTGDTSQIKVYQLPCKAWQRPPNEGVLKTPLRPRKDPPKTPERPPQGGGRTGNLNINKEEREKRADALPDLIEFPPELESGEFKTAWNNWTAYRKERKKPLVASTVKLQLAKLAEFGHAGALVSIHQSIEAGWEGLFAPKQPQTGYREYNRPKTRPINGYENSPL